MIVNAQQYISSRCARRIDCTVSVPYYDFMAAVYCRDVFFFLSLLPNVIATEHTGPMS